jgi:hypothetical protein
MGQRHQVYIYVKQNNKYRCISAHHHQWCYGVTAASNLVRLVQATELAKGGSDWSECRLTVARETDVLVKAIYGIDPETGYVSMVHDESEHLIDAKGNAMPDLGDNNDGCGVIVIDEDTKSVRGCLFTPGHIEAKNSANAEAWKAWPPIEYARFYYSKAELKKFDDKKRVALITDNAVKPIKQAEFNKLFKSRMKG